MQLVLHICFHKVYIKQQEHKQIVPKKKNDSQKSI